MEPWRLQLARLRAHYGSDAALAGVLGVGQTSVRNWLGGRCAPRPDTRLEIGRRYDVLLGFPDLTSESLIAARQACDGVLEMETVEACHAHARRCLDRLDHLLSRLAA